MPICGVAVWLLIVRGSYRSVEKIFLLASGLYVTYIISAILVKPDWKEALIYSVKPVLMLDVGYITMLIAMVGTSIAPWMQFYLQAAVVEKGITEKDYRASRIEVIVGCIGDLRDRILHHRGLRRGDLGERPPRHRRCRRRRPGTKAVRQVRVLLFSAGLFNASLFAASILPLSTAYSVCEGMGFEAGVNKSFREAPVFYWLYGLLIVVGGGVVMIPGFPLVRMILFSQVLNGVLLPVVLIFMIKLINRKELMGDWTNSHFYNWVAWISVVLMIGLTLALVGITIRQMGS